VFEGYLIAFIAQKQGRRRANQGILKLHFPSLKLQILNQNKSLAERAPRRELWIVGAVLFELLAADYAFLTWS
jgi:hypothetical protein